MTNYKTPAEEMTITRYNHQQKVDKIKSIVLGVQNLSPNSSFPTNSCSSFMHLAISGRPKLGISKQKPTASKRGKEGNEVVVSYATHRLFLCLHSQRQNKLFCNWHRPVEKGIQKTRHGSLLHNRDHSSWMDDEDKIFSLQMQVLQSRQIIAK